MARVVEKRKREAELSSRFHRYQPTLQTTRRQWFWGSLSTKLDAGQTFKSIPLPLNKLKFRFFDRIPPSRKLSDLEPVNPSKTRSDVAPALSELLLRGLRLERNQADQKLASGLLCTAFRVRMSYLNLLSWLTHCIFQSPP